MLHFDFDHVERSLHAKVQVWYMHICRPASVHASTMKPHYNMIVDSVHSVVFSITVCSVVPSIVFKYSVLCSAYDTICRGAIASFASFVNTVGVISRPRTTGLRSLALKCMRRRVSSSRVDFRTFPLTPEDRIAPLSKPISPKGALRGDRLRGDQGDWPSLH